MLANGAQQACGPRDEVLRKIWRETAGCRNADKPEGRARRGERGRPMKAEEQDPRRVIRKLNLVGFSLMVVMLGGFGGWAATSEIGGAVIASGQLVVESNVKKVQHPTGGIVGEILVREGDAVEAGQIVMRLDDTVTRATLGVVRSQLDELTAREARLLAERDGAMPLSSPTS